MNVPQYGEVTDMFWHVLTMTFLAPEIFEYLQEWTGIFLGIVVPKWLNWKSSAWDTPILTIET